MINCGKRTYCIDWNIEVNGRKVVDHNWDLDEQSKWNVILNDRKLRDVASQDENNEYKIEVQDLHDKDEDPLKMERLLRPVVIMINSDFRK